MLLRFGVCLVVLLCGVLVACDGERDEPTERTGPPVVFTTFYPTAYFAERIGGDLIEVVCPVPEDEDAIFWNPDPATLARYQAADLIVVNGADFEKWVLKVSLPLGRVVNTAKAFEDEFIVFTDVKTHTHGPAGEHTHEGVDGHTWLDPILARTQALAVFERLVKLLPDQEKTLRANHVALVADLDGLDAGFREMLDTYEGERILASHPAYNYIARRYGWKIVNLDLDPETVPDAEELAGIGKLVAEEPVRFILWESEPVPDVAAALRALGIESVTFSPCELMSAEDLAAGADYLSVMRGNAERVAPVFRPSGK